MSAAETSEMMRAVRAGSAPAAGPNLAMHGTAARLRFGMKPNGLVWVAARDRRRWT